MNQSTSLYVCAITLHSLTYSIPGVYYLRWKKGQRFTQSTRQNISSNDTYIINQKLELHLKIYSHSGTKKNKNTYLYLMNEQNQEICTFLLRVQKWTQEPLFIKLIIKDSHECEQAVGELCIWVHSKLIMHLQNFDKFVGDLEESEETQENSVQEQIKVSEEDINNQIEIKKLRQTLQDSEYLCDKMKSDRDRFFQKCEILQRELSNVKKCINGEFQRLCKHHEEKIHRHKQIYNEEIQELINNFNSNGRFLHESLRRVIEQNEEMSKLLIKREEDVRNKEDECFEMNEKMRAKCQQIAELENILEKSGNRLKELQRQLQEKQQRIDQKINALKQRQIQLMQLREQNRKYTQKMEKQIQGSKQQNTELKSCLKNKEEQCMQQHSMNQSLLNEVQFMKGQIDTLTADNQAINSELFEFRISSEQLSNKLKQSQLSHLQNQQQMHAQLLEQSHLSQLQKTKNHELSLKIQELTHALALKQNQLEIVQAELDKVSEQVKSLEINKINNSSEMDELITKAELLQKNNDELHQHNDILIAEFYKICEMNLHDLQEIAEEFEELDLMRKKFIEQLYDVHFNRIYEGKVDLDLLNSKEMKIESMRRNFERKLGNLDRQFRERFGNNDHKIATLKLSTTQTNESLINNRSQTIFEVQQFQCSQTIENQTYKQLIALLTKKQETISRFQDECERLQNQCREMIRQDDELQEILINNAKEIEELRKLNKDLEEKVSQFGKIKKEIKKMKKNYQKDMKNSSMELDRQLQLAESISQKQSQIRQSLLKKSKTLEMTASFGKEQEKQIMEQINQQINYPKMEIPVLSIKELSQDEEMDLLLCNVFQLTIYPSKIYPIVPAQRQYPYPNYPNNQSRRSNRQQNQYPSQSQYRNIFHSSLTPQTMTNLAKNLNFCHRVMDVQYIGVGKQSATEQIFENKDAIIEELKKQEVVFKSKYEQYEQIIQTKLKEQTQEKQILENQIQQLIAQAEKEKIHQLQLMEKNEKKTYEYENCIKEVEKKLKSIEKEKAEQEQEFEKKMRDKKMEIERELEKNKEEKISWEKKEKDLHEKIKEYELKIMILNEKMDKIEKENIMMEFRIKEYEKEELRQRERNKNQNQKMAHMLDKREKTIEVKEHKIEQLTSEIRNLTKQQSYKLLEISELKHQLATSQSRESEAQLIHQRLRKQTQNIERLKKESDHKIQILKQQITKQSQHIDKLNQLYSESQQVIKVHKTQINEDQQQLLKYEGQINKAGILLKELSTQLKELIEQNQSLEACLQEKCEELFRSNSVVASLEQEIAKITRQMFQQALENNQSYKSLKIQYEELQGEKKQLERIKQQVIRKKENLIKKNEDLQILNQKYAYQIKTLKKKIENYEGSEVNAENINKSKNIRLKQLEKQNEDIASELLKTKRDYEKYKLYHSTTQQTLENKFEEWKKNKEQDTKAEITKIIEGVAEEYAIKTEQLQKQIVNSFNDNDALSNEVTRLQQELSTLFNKLQELETANKELSNMRTCLLEVSQQLKISKEKQASYKLALQTLMQQIEDVSSQNSKLIKIVIDLQKQANNLSQHNLQLLQQLSNTETQLEESKYHHHQTKTIYEQQIQAIKQQIQNNENKLLSKELEVQRISTREINLRDQYQCQLSSMQNKLKLLIEEHKAESEARQKFYKQDLQKKNNEAAHLSKSLQARQVDVKNLKQDIGSLRVVGDQLRIQLLNTREQLEDEEQKNTRQIIELREVIKHLEKAHEETSASMEEQIINLTKQLFKYKETTNFNQSKQAQGSRCLLEKVKRKEQQIVCLSQHIQILENALRRSKTPSEVEVEVGPVLQISEYQLTKNQEQIQEFVKIKEKLTQSVIHENTLNLKIQALTLEKQSLLIELNTINQLYQSLQQQIKSKTQQSQIFKSADTSVQSLNQLTVSYVGDLQDRNQEMTNEIYNLRESVREFTKKEKNLVNEVQFLREENMKMRVEEAKRKESRGEGEQEMEGLRERIKKLEEEGAQGKKREESLQRSLRKCEKELDEMMSESIENQAQNHKLKLQLAAQQQRITHYSPSHIITQIQDHPEIQEIELLKQKIQALSLQMTLIKEREAYLCEKQIKLSIIEGEYGNCELKAEERRVEIEQMEKERKLLRRELERVRELVVEAHSKEQGKEMKEVLMRIMDSNNDNI